MRKSTLFTLFMSILGPTLLTPVNAEEDLIYVAVDPCRIVDTREAGGAITASKFRNFLVYGSLGELAVQGGKTDCLNPKARTGQKPLAISAYVVAVPAPGSINGVLTAYPSDKLPPPPGAGSTVNYAAGQVVGNTTNITLCNQSNCPTDGEFAILARNTDQHVVIDVQGYFYPATTPRKHFYSIPAEAFKSNSDPLPVFGGMGGAFVSDPGFHAMVATVHLPDGAMITRFTMYFVDNDTSDLEMYLQYRDNASPGFLRPLSALESSGTSGDENMVESLTDTLSHEVGNERYNYYVEVWTNWPGTRALRINAALLEYTIREAP